MLKGGGPDLRPRAPAPAAAPPRVNPRDPTAVNPRAMSAEAFLKAGKPTALPPKPASAEAFLKAGKPLAASEGVEFVEARFVEAGSGEAGAEAAIAIAVEAKVITVNKKRGGRSSRSSQGFRVIE